MARPNPTATPPTATYTVLRAICMHGERVEVGALVEMTPLQYAEAHNAGKVGPYVAPDAPAKAAKKQKAADPQAPAADAPAAATTPEETTP